MIEKIYKQEENMVLNMITVLSNIGVSITSVLSTVYGKLVVLIVLIGTYFASIAGMIHVMIALVIIDAVFGIAVTLKKKGVGYIISSRLRNTLYKMFFYLLFLVLTFLVEYQITGVECIAPKIVFAIMSGVELWSISANALILSPNFPFLRVFKKYLVQEIGKKLNMTSDEVEEFLNEKKESNEEK